MSTWQKCIGDNLIKECSVIIKDSVGTIEEKQQGNTKTRTETDNQGRVKILDPIWNSSPVVQVIGRVIRINNHNSNEP